MEDVNIDLNNPPVEAEKNKLQQYISLLSKNKPRVGILIFVLIIIFSFLYIYIQQQPAEESTTSQLSPTLIAAKKQPSSTPTTSTVLPTESITYKVIPTFTITPTSIPVATNTSAPAATNTPVPRTANPPKFKITFPSEGQSIELNSNQTFCAVEVSDGGDHTSVLKRVNINNSSWTVYSSPTTTCYTPDEGQNNLKMQFKNSYDDESSEYSVNFTFHRTE